MKKSILILLTLLLSATTFSQSSDGKKLGSRFGFYGGPNLFCYRGDSYADDSKLKLGFQVGALSNMPVGENIYLQPEINVAQIGAKYDFSYMGSGETQKVNMLYGNFVLVGQYHTSAGVYLELGPQIGYLFSAKSKFGDETDDVKDNYKKTALAINLGVGYRVNNNVRVGARYVYGISQMAKEDENDLKFNGFAANVRYIMD